MFKLNEIASIEDRSQEDLFKIYLMPEGYEQLTKNLRIFNKI